MDQFPLNKIIFKKASLYLKNIFVSGSGTGAAISGKIFLDYGGDFLFHSMALMSLVAGISYQCFILVANKTKKKNVNNNDQVFVSSFSNDFS